jgi:hypothetical protein
MKTLRVGIAITLLIIPISALAISQKPYADDTNKRDSSIKAHMDKIVIEREAIIADGRKLQEAKKTGDKAKIEQVKNETDQDIKKRKAAIRALYKDIDKQWVGDTGNKKVKRP